VQLHQPWTLLHVGLLTRQILRLSCVHQVYFEPRTVQILDSSESRMGYRRGFPLIWRASLQLPPGATMA
jgi:hypothetical protein